MEKDKNVSIQAIIELFFFTPFIAAAVVLDSREKDIKDGRKCGFIELSRAYFEFCLMSWNMCRFGLCNHYRLTDFFK